MRVSSTADVAQLMGISPRRLRTLIRDGRVPGVVVRGKGRGHIKLMVIVESLPFPVRSRLEMADKTVDIEQTAILQKIVSGIANCYIPSDERGGKCKPGQPKCKHITDVGCKADEVSKFLIYKEIQRVNDLQELKEQNVGSMFLYKEKLYINCKLLAQLLLVSKQGVGKRLRKGGRYVEVRSRGGRARYYLVDSLPTEWQLAIWEHLVSTAYDGPSRTDVDRWMQASDSEREMALFRLHCVMRAKEVAACKRYGSRVAAQELLIDELQRTYGRAPSLKTLYRWCASYEKNGFSGLIPAKRMKQVDEHLTRALEIVARHYRLSTQPSIALAYEMAMGDIAMEGLPIPHYSQVRKFIKGIPRAVLIRDREGERAYRQKVMPYINRDYDGMHPNDVWVADHKQVEVAVRVQTGLNAKTGEPIYRTFFPWITAVMDVRSRVICGYAITEVPSSTSIRSALRQSIIRCGIPKKILIDNGRDFTARVFTSGSHKGFRDRKVRVDLDRDVRGFFAMAGIVPTYAIPGNARSKSVERFFRTIVDQFSKRMPGYRGRDITDRPETVNKLIERCEVVDFEEFCASIEDFVVQYINRVHTGKGMNGRSPLQLFREWAMTHTVAYPMDEESLVRLLLPFTRRKVGRHGVQLFKMNYYSPTLVEDYFDMDVVVRYDPSDLTVTYIYSLDGQFIGIADRVSLYAFDDIEGIKDLKRRERALKMAQVKYDVARADLYEKELLRAKKKLDDVWVFNIERRDLFAQVEKSLTIGDDKMKDIDDLDREFFEKFRYRRSVDGS